ncbi:hypothetical protein VNO77_23504 [Canavalia gladiata]|uniref:Uncharacterized protein n=1 Tax=Canavalia gladiata TaxID=3824 RepID=A0AAN9QBX0_CANGL
MIQPVWNRTYPIEVLFIGGNKQIICLVHKKQTGCQHKTQALSVQRLRYLFGFLFLTDRTRIVLDTHESEFGFCFCG